MNAVYFSSVVLHSAVVVDTVRHRKCALALQADFTDRYCILIKNAITLWHISILHVMKPQTLPQSLEQELAHRHMRKCLTAVLPRWPPQDFRLIETMATSVANAVWNIVAQTRKAHWTWSTKMAPVASKFYWQNIVYA